MSDDEAAEGGGAPGGGSPGFDYAALMRSALLGVVRQVLAATAASGLPGDHHFLLIFGTAEDGVLMPERLRRQFPEEMTIVLQRQFWGLETDEDGFAVTLRFSGAPERLIVPWSALRAFVDPSVGFGLRLRPGQESTPEPAAASAPEASSAPQGDNVVDFGSFRRKGGEPG